MTTTPKSQGAAIGQRQEDIRIARHCVFNLKEFRAGRSTFPGEALGILEKALDRLAAIDQAGVPAALSPDEIDAKLYASLQHVGGALCDAVPFREVKAFADHFAASLLAAPAGDTQPDKVVYCGDFEASYFIRKDEAGDTQQANGDARDAARLDFVTANRDMQLRCHKKGWLYHGFTSYEIDVFKTPREAIDAAMSASQANKACLDGGEA